MQAVEIGSPRLGQDARTVDLFGGRPARGARPDGLRARAYDAKAPFASAPAPATGADWASFANDGGAQYSPASQINRGNVTRLKLAWESRSGDFRNGKFGTGTSFETTPLFTNGLVYYCTPLNRVFAVDPDTGKTRWVFNPAGGAHPLLHELPRPQECRGLAYWQDPAPTPGEPCAKRVMHVDSSSRLYAIDADTGRICPDFGPNAHPGYVTNSDYDNFGQGGLYVTSAPTVIGHVVLFGNVLDDGIQDAVDGIVRAFDVRTGTLAWQFDPIPEAYRHKTGAANAWAWISADPKNNLVFVPTTSPSRDYYGADRKFDMPLTDAVVALNAQTGKAVWHFQIIRHDLWDYDLPNHPVLATIRKDGKLIDVAIEATKTGYLYVLDRLTGKPVFPVYEYAAPASNLPEEQAAATQPLSTLPTFARTTLKRSDMFGVIGLDKLWCLNAFDRSRYQGMFTTPGLDPSIQMPSTLGGGSWGSVAFDPATDSVIVKASNVATRLHFFKNGAGSPKLDWTDFEHRHLDGPYGVIGDWFLSPIGIPCTPPPYGQLTSISMDTGKVRWQVPFGQSHRYGVTTPAFLNWGSPNIGGPITTGGALVFAGATLDGRLRAYNAETGKELWQTKLPWPGMATPMTYMHNGKQYVVIAAGGSALAETAQGDAVMAYALP